MSLVAGTVTTSGAITPADSMAQAIASELEKQVPLRSSEDPTGRNKLAVAIATGVIGYLRTHNADFTVAVPDGAGGVITETVVIA